MSSHISYPLFAHTNSLQRLDGIINSFLQGMILQTQNLNGLLVVEFVDVCRQITGGILRRQFRLQLGMCLPDSFCKIFIGETASRHEEPVASRLRDLDCSYMSQSHIPNVYPQECDSRGETILKFALDQVSNSLVGSV